MRSPGLTIVPTLIDRGGGLPTPTEARPRIGRVLRGGGGGLPRRASPRGGGPSPSTTRYPCPPAGTRVPEGVGGRSRWTSWTSDATGGSASGASRGLPASPTMTCVPTTPATAGTGGLGWDRNFLAKERNFCIRVSVGNARADTVSMIMPRYSTDLDGERSDFSVFITMSREQHCEELVGVMSCLGFRGGQDQPVVQVS